LFSSSFCSGSVEQYTRKREEEIPRPGKRRGTEVNSAVMRCLQRSNEVGCNCGPGHDDRVDHSTGVEAAGLLVAVGGNLAADEVGQDAVEQRGVRAGHLHVRDRRDTGEPELAVGIEQEHTGGDGARDENETGEGCFGLTADLETDGLAEVEYAEEQQVEREVGCKQTETRVVQDVDLYLPDTRRETEEDFCCIGHEVNGTDSHEADEQRLEEVRPSGLCMCGDADLIDCAVPLESDGKDQHGQQCAAAEPEDEAVGVVDAQDEVYLRKDILPVKDCPLADQGIDDGRHHEVEDEGLVDAGNRSGHRTDDRCKELLIEQEGDDREHHHKACDDAKGGAEFLPTVGQVVLRGGCGSEVVVEELTDIADRAGEQQRGRVTGRALIESTNGTVSHGVGLADFNGVDTELLGEGIVGDCFTRRELAAAVGVIPGADENAHVDAFEGETAGCNVHDSLDAFADDLFVGVGGCSPLASAAACGVTGNTDAIAVNDLEGREVVHCCAGADIGSDIGTDNIGTTDRIGINGHRDIAAAREFDVQRAEVFEVCVAAGEQQDAGGGVVDGCGFGDVDFRAHLITVNGQEVNALYINGAACGGDALCEAEAAKEQHECDQNDGKTLADVQFHFHSYSFQNFAAKRNDTP